MQKHRIKLGAALLAVFILAGISFGQDDKEPTFLSIGKTFVLSGATQFQYADWDKGVDSYSIRRVLVSLNGEILKKMRYKLSISFANAPVILDANIEYEFAKPVQIRVGQFMVPFSLENVTSTPDQDMVNRSQPVEKLVPSEHTRLEPRNKKKKKKKHLPKKNKNIKKIANCWQRCALLAPFACDTTLELRKGIRRACLEILHPARRPLKS